jgi:hypothetical protein
VLRTALAVVMDVLKAEPWAGLLSGALGGVVVLLVGQALQARADRIKREPAIAVRLVTKDVYASAAAVAGAATVATLGVATGGVRGKTATPPLPPQPTSPRSMSAATPPPSSEPQRLPDRDVFHALVRNLSERPAAVVDVALARADGTDVPIRKQDYARRMGLPLVLGPWGVAAVQVQIDFPELRDADVLVLRDMDDKEIRVPLRGAEAWQRWVTYD